MATPRQRTGPVHIAIRLLSLVSPADKPDRGYLVINTTHRKVVACVSAGHPSNPDCTGETVLPAAGFAKCEVVWELLVPWSTLRQSLDLLPSLAKRPARRKQAPATRR